MQPKSLVLSTQSNLSSNKMGSYLFIAIMTLVGLARAQTQADYCKISPNNTMCLYVPYQYASTCPIIIPTTISAADKQFIVDVHNKLRSSVALGLETRGAPGPQPKASNLRALDDELALMADTHVRQCVYKHDENHVAYEGFKLNNPGVNWTWSVQKWFDEVSDFNSSQVSQSSCALGKQIGHYAQVVWANTYKVGCSVETNGFYRFFYACNYGPAGNSNGKPVYLIGNPASACPGGTTADTNTGLCI